MTRFALALLGGCAVTLLAGAALADPPGRVGRISDVEGDVSFLPPGETDWTYADRNFPVTAGESFWTDDNGRVELQAGSMEIAGDSDTELDVLTLDYGQTRLGLSQGSIDLRLWRAPRGGVTIATPAGDIEINAAGAYRIDVGAPQDDGSYPPVELTVFDGDAGAPGPDGFADVQAGQAALIYAGYDPQYDQAQDGAIDDWARSREQGESWDSQASFSPSMTGYEDLAGQGQFVSDPDYGTVWYPNDVPDGWAPYQFGHWAYVNPWGYTWIDDQAWGFAPFHYGRWVQVQGRWGWVPGQAAAEPVYAPALVAFFGFGAAIGWAPLAPDEIYRPTYQVSDDYWRRVNAASVRPEVFQNVTINTTVNIRSYRNAGAAVVVGPDTLANGGRVGAAATRVAPGQLAQAAPVVPRAFAPPTARAMAGGAARTGGAGAARPSPPPSRLAAVRASVAAAPTGSSRPPAIAGARIAPPKPRPAGAPAFVAPAQVKNPALQARKPVAPPPGAARAATPPSGPPAARSPLGTPPENRNRSVGPGAPAERETTRPTPPSEAPAARQPARPEPAAAPPVRTTRPPSAGAPGETPSPSPRPGVTPNRQGASPPAQGAARPAAPPPEKKPKPKPDEKNPPPQ